MLIEVCGALARDESMSTAVDARKRLNQLATQNSLVVYDLDKAKMQRAVTIAIDYRIKGADATYAALSDELGLNLITFDEKSLANPLRNGGFTQVVVP